MKWMTGKAIWEEFQVRYADEAHPDENPVCFVEVNGRQFAVGGVNADGDLDLTSADELIQVNGSESVAFPNVTFGWEPRPE